MRRLPLLAFLALLASLAACSYPAEQTRMPEGRPSLMVEGAPSDSLLYVDGLDMGSATSGRAVLVEPGTHQVKVVSGGTVLFQEKMFVSGSITKTINLAR
jgi:hypothetical protein